MKTTVSILEKASLTLHVYVCVCVMCVCVRMSAYIHMPLGYNNGCQLHRKVLSGAEEDN